MSETDILTQEKLRKLGEIQSQNINPYPHSYTKTDFAAKIKQQFAHLATEEHSGKQAKIAGRIMQLRRMGKASFMHIQDETDRLQIYIREDIIGEEPYAFMKKLDLGDIIGVEGEIFKTKTGEITLQVSSSVLLCKSTRPLPEKFHGLKDKELRYRKRYLDLISNQDIQETFRKRSIMIKAIRDFLHKKEFMEVETPLLQTQYGGASARPFKTHINAWNMPMFLSISPELYLKRLIVGGFEKVFTICKNFRNEGVDHTHNPEFTMIEIYQAYADYTDMMKLLEECYEYAALKVNGTTKIKRIYEGQEIEIDVKAPWPKKTMAQAIQECLGIDVLSMSAEELLEFCNRENIPVQGESWGDYVLTIFGEKVEHTIIQPTHIYDMPKEGTPLCKRHRSDDRLNEQCEPIGLGMELGNMYTELNDPLLQKKLLEEQVEKGRGGDEEAHPYDADFVEALEIGMPPTGGIGWGIDRMAIILTNQESIRDVIFFPTMKPEEQNNTPLQ